MSAEQVAAEHYRAQQRLAASTAKVAADAWRQVDTDRVIESWRQLSGQVTLAVAGGQQAAAGQANSYLDRVLSEQGIGTDTDGQVNPAAFSGVASDGRELDTLVQQPAALSAAALRRGDQLPRALAAGRASLDMIVRTQVADAGRTADQVALVAHRSASGYVRLLAPPSCSRCAILAGRWYRYSAGFSRHPRCDCRHLPSTRDFAGDLRTSPRAYFDSLSLEEQDRIFTKAGAQAIRDGADMSQVVNARRGMHTAGGRRLTRESTTRLGVARPGRLMPEEIYRLAGSRAEAIALLRQHGYLRAAPTRGPLPTAPVPPTARLATTQLPLPAQPVRTAQQRLDDLVAAVPANAARTKLAGGKSATTELVQTPAGSLVHKRAHDWGNTSPAVQESLVEAADAEYLAARVGMAVDAPVAAVVKDRPDSVWVEWVPGARPAEDWVDTEAGRRIGLLDVLAANPDRNPANILRAGDGRVVGIDHGFSWSSAVMRNVPEEPGSAPNLSPATKHFVSDRWPAYIDNPLSPAEVDLIRGRLEGLRPEFDALDRGYWLDYSLAVLEQLRRHATGPGLYG